MKRHYVYLHKNRDGDVFYVGCATTNPEKRGVRAKHQRAYCRFGHSKHWHDRAKRGFSVEIVLRTDNRDIAFKKERELINKFRKELVPIVNVCNGGPGAPGLKDTPETRRKKAITKLGPLNPMYGRNGAGHPNSRRVRDNSTGVVYDSVKLAAEAVGVKMKTLYNWLSGHRPNPTTLEFA